MTAVRPEDTILIEPFGEYRNIFTVLHSVHSLGDARVEPLFKKLTEADGTFIKELSAFLTTIHHHSEHDAAIKYIGSELKSYTTKQFEASIQPILSHYLRLCNSLPAGTMRSNWESLCGLVIIGLGKYPPHIKDGITEQGKRLLLDATLSILLVDDPSNHLLREVRLRHFISDEELAGMILTNPDKEALVNKLLRGGNTRTVEIAAVLNGDTLVPLVDGVL